MSEARVSSLHSGRLKDFRRVATRYDKLARTFLDTVTLAAIHAFWL